MKEYIIPEELVQALLSYLKSRPYIEVFEGVQALESLKAIEKEEESK